MLACLGVFAFLLSGSDLSLSSGSGDPAECETDADCASCCASLRGSGSDVSLDPCLLPPPNASRVCVDRCCVSPAPVYAEDGTPCDDGAWCTADDRCSLGECAGVPRQCSDADFCTVEECSETQRGCVSGAFLQEGVCENVCSSDADCRSGYFCLPSERCGRLPDTNGTMMFTGYEIEACAHALDAWSMTQHYVVWEQAYEGPQGERRYLTVSSVVLPSRPRDVFALAYSDALDGAPLSFVDYVSETSVLFLSGAEFTKTSLTLRSACLPMLPDDSSCLSAWANRQYEFEIVFDDCVRDAGDGETAMFSACVRSDARRAYTSDLSVVDCPLLPTTRELLPVSSLRMEYASSPGVALSSVRSGERVRAVVETSVGDWLDPFLVNVTLCVVDSEHRLSGCATNERREGCPFRGCTGWSSEDSPVLRTRQYMVAGEWTAEASLDTVGFCREKTRYDEAACAAGVCGWSALPNRTAWGGADGFSFPVLDGAGAILVADVGVRLERCGGAGRRLEKRAEALVERRVGLLSVERPSR